MEAIKLSFECECVLTIWGQSDRVSSALSCCKKHEVNGQQLSNILKKCPMILTDIGEVR